MTKSVIQVFLISLAKTVGKQEVLVHHLLFMAIVTCLLFYAYKQRTFNYDVMNLWHTVSIMCLAWLAILNFIEYLTRETLALVILLLIGWFSMILTGFLIKRQRYVSLLFFKQNEHLQELFAFGFQFNALMENSRIFASRNIYRSGSKDKDVPVSSALQMSSGDFARSSDALRVIPEREEAPN
jgi:hypothetical protein